MEGISVLGSAVGKSRRWVLARGVAAAAIAATGPLAKAVAAGPIRFALTPVLLTSDLNLLDLIKASLEAGTGRPVQLVTRRTYQEITNLLVSGQVDGAWICGYPFVAYRAQLDLLAVPIWRGRPLYQSYLIADAGRGATSIDDLKGDVHAFSDPDSNSGFLVTAADLARKGTTPDGFFRQTVFTYGHSNVVRAVASGLAQSGSVDGYVYEVLREVQPDLVSQTGLVRASDWYAFPPIACQAGTAKSENTVMLRRALLGLHETPEGSAALAALRLDRFSEEPTVLFDSIAANMNLVRGLG
jgi:phosphonate transport system substrate-binding protein